MLKHSVLICSHVLAAVLCCVHARAQQAPPAPARPEFPLPEKPQPRPSPDAQGNPQAAPHRFWDRENKWLFAGVAVARALDYHSTGNMRRRGRDEILLTNEVVDNKPAFVAVEAAGALASVGVSYLFHRTGHHKLERWTSYVHIGVGLGGAVRNYCLKSRLVSP